MAIDYKKCLVCQREPQTKGETTCEPCAYRMAHRDEILSDVMSPTIIAALTANLREFGYDVTAEYVKAEVMLIATGKQPVTIIGIMARTQLQQNGLLAE